MNHQNKIEQQNEKIIELLKSIVEILLEGKNIDEEAKTRIRILIYNY